MKFTQARAVNRVSPRAARIYALAAACLMLAGVFIAAPGAHDRADAQAVAPSVTWSALGAGVTTNGTADIQRFGCGLLHCSTTTNAYGRTGKSSGSATPNLYRVRIQSEHPVITGSVSVGSGGVSVGATVQNSTCISNLYPSSSGASFVSIRPGGEFCTARGATALSMTYKVSGEYRVGSSWSSNSASKQGG